MKCCVKNYGFSQKIKVKTIVKTTIFPIYFIEFLQGTPFTIWPADYTKVPHPSPSTA